MSHLEYIDRFQKQREFYKKAVVTDARTKRQSTWPYNPKTAELAYEKWKQEVMDPVTKEYYKGKEEYEGQQIRKVIQVITRERTPEGKEYLTTKGQLIGFNEFGEISADTIYSFGGDHSCPDFYEETKFAFRRGLGSDGKLKMECHGPTGSAIIHYKMEWNSDNVEELWKQRDTRMRTSLVVKDTMRGTAKECPDIEMFKTKDFDYIMNMGYLSEKEREERRLEFETMQDNLRRSNKK